MQLVATCLALVSDPDAPATVLVVGEVDGKAVLPHRVCSAVTALLEPVRAVVGKGGEAAHYATVLGVPLVDPQPLATLAARITQSLEPS